MTEQAPTFAEARYVKGKVVMCCPPDSSGYKTRAMRLAAAHGARWSRRSGYVMSPTSAAKAVALWHAGYDAYIRVFTSDKRRAKELLIPPKDTTS